MQCTNCELDDLQAALDLTHGIRQDLSMLRRNDGSQIVNAILDDPQEPIEDPDAMQRCVVGRFWERRTSGSDSFMNLIRPCEVDGT
jgi:hypothetical protein